MKLSHASLVFATLAVAGSVRADDPSVVNLGLLPGDRLVAPAVNSQAEVSAARGADSTLIVWTDSRARSGGGQSVQSDSDLFGIRIAPSGAPIDASPFMIAGGMGTQRRPMVAWSGSAWLVVFLSQDPSGGYFEDRTRAVRVSAAGQVLDATPISFPPTQFTPDWVGTNVAGLNGQWLITRCVYHDDGYGTYLAGQRISAAGALLDPDPRMLIDWVYGNTKVLASNTEYLVAGPTWNDGSVFTARRISASAQPVNAAFGVPSLSIAGNGTEYYVAWVSNYTNLVGSRMTAAGTLLNPAGTLLFSNFSGDAAITHDGSNWWLAWTVAANARTLRVSPAGAVLDPGGVLLPITIGGNIDTIYTPNLVATPGGGTTFVWHDMRAAAGSDANAYALPLSPANTPGVERCVSTGTTNQRTSDISDGPAGASAVVFVSETANDDRVLLHLLTATGAPVNPEPIEVFRSPTIGRASIAWNGSVYMVAWDTGASGQLATQIKARRLNPDGSFIDAAPFDVMPGFNPDVGALGDDFLFAASRYAFYPQYIDLWARRYDGTTASFTDAAPLGLAGGYYIGYNRVRADNTRWLVTSSTQWTHDSSQGDAVYVSVPPVGTPLPARNPTPWTGASGDLDAAFSGSVILFVWRNNSLSNANNYIVGRLMNPDGTFPGTAFTIAEAPGRQLRPTVGWNGSEFVVAWDDQRNQASFYDARTDVFAARVSESGVVTDPAAIGVVCGVEGDLSPALLSTPDGRTLVSTTRFTLTGPEDSYRVGLSMFAMPSAICAGDFSADHAVNTDDLVLLLNGFDKAVQPRTAGDMTGDGGVNTADLALFLAAFGSNCP
ncbi:MAG: hypothetical protein J0L61_00135 [Planctomycetes bacterium]|nr:hypothetical protein [Planctomycetota bacterium]